MGRGKAVFVRQSQGKIKLFAKKSGKICAFQVKVREIFVKKSMLSWMLKTFITKIFISFQIDFYGKSKAKVSLSILDRLKEKQNGKYVVVAGFISFSILLSNIHYYVIII